MKIIFAGTPDIAATCLQALLNSEHDVVAIYTQPDRPQGRGKKLSPSPVKTLAIKHNIDLQQPTSLKAPEEKATLKQYEADVMVVIAYGLILPADILNIPRYGCINIHTSLLPQYRGPAPVQHSILKGDTQTGVTLMQMDSGLDTGPILQQRTCDIANNDTTETLLNKLALLGSETLLSTLKNIGSIKATPQDTSRVSYAGKINKVDAMIDWSRSAEEIDRAIRAYQPWPIAFSDIDHVRIRFFDARVLKQTSAGMPGEIVAINDNSLDIACGKNILRVTTLQLPNKKPMSVRDIINGHPDLFMLGTCFHAST